MKSFNELVSNTLQTVETSVANQNTHPHGLISEDGKTMTRLERSRQAGMVDQTIVAKITNRLLSTSLWPTAPTDELRKYRISLLEETKALPSYEDAAVLVARFTAHFPRRDESERAVVIGDIAAACARHEITIIGLSVALTELVESARSAHPFMPPTGEILHHAQKKSALFGICLENDKRAIT